MEVGDEAKKMVACDMFSHFAAKRIFTVNLWQPSNVSLRTPHIWKNHSTTGGRGGLWRQRNIQRLKQKPK